MPAFLSTMAGIPLDKAEMLALFMETFFYGIFFTLFCITLCVLCSTRHGSINIPLVITSIIMMFLATGHITIDVIRIMEAFITKHDTTEGGAIGYYLNLSNPLHTTKTAFYVAQTLTGDSLVLWRCFVIHGRAWTAVIIPILLLTGSFITGCGGTHFLSIAKPGVTVFQTARPWITAFFVLTLCQNLYCTGSIVYRIWSTDRAVKGYRENYSLTPILLVVVESGALYSSALLALLITYLVGTNGQYPVLDSVQPFVGIVFSLIIIQIRVFASRKSSGSDSTSERRWKSARRTRPSVVNTFPLHGVSVEVSQTTHADGEEEMTSDVTPPTPIKREDMWHEEA